MDFGLEFKRCHDEKRHCHQCDQRQLPADGQHHDGAEGHHQQHVEKLSEAEADKHPDRFQVARQTGHQIARSSRVIITE